jgi:hypothetical protein
MNSFFLKKASLIADSERDKWRSEIWKSDPYFIYRVNRGVEKKTRHQEKDVSTTTLHDQLPSLGYSIRRPTREGTSSAESTGLRKPDLYSGAAQRSIKIVGL